MATRNTLQKQRSIQMDDETYDLLVGAAERRNISRAAIIRELIHNAHGSDRALLPEPPPPRRRSDKPGHDEELDAEDAARRERREQRRLSAASSKAVTAPAGPEIALPDTRADTFDVSGGKVRAKRSRPKLGEIEL